MIKKNVFTVSISYEGWQKKKKPSVIKFLNICEAFMFSNISKLLKILCVLPVSTAEPERFFSKLDKTLTCLRARMGEERLESLIMLQVHRNRTPSVDEVINTFCRNQCQKVKFSYVICNYSCKLIELFCKNPHT